MENKMEVIEGLYRDSGKKIEPTIWGIGAYIRV